MFFVLCMDDILINGSNILVLHFVNIYCLPEYFSMKDLSKATYILGI